MNFNTGFKCIDCGPIPTATNKTINKTQYKVCPKCSKVVSAWQRPLNERVGRCKHCANGGFKQAIGKGKYKGAFLTQCTKCGQVANPDTGDILKQGDEKHEYKQ